MSDKKKARSDEDIDYNALLKAIKVCLLENRGLRPTARSYNIPKSTLDRHVKKLKNSHDVSNMTDDELMNVIKVNRMHLPTNMVSKQNFPKS